jgi:eukaryotic-like serine/threonine-protein kinase
VRCVVPRLKGKTLAAARAALSRGNCRLGKVTRAYSRTVRLGRIALQRPAAGVRLARGAKVSVVISRGRRG